MKCEVDNAALETKSCDRSFLQSRIGPVRGGNPMPPLGSVDLDPFAAGGGGFGDPLRSGAGRSGGMIMGPDDPIFSGRGGMGMGGPGLRGGPRPGHLPTPPPGARFDPVGPFGNDPTRSNEPDPDHLQTPPGYDDMFM